MYWGVVPMLLLFLSDVTVSLLISIFLFSKVIEVLGSGLQLHLLCLLLWLGYLFLFSCPLLGYLNLF